MPKQLLTGYLEHGLLKILLTSMRFTCDHVGEYLLELLLQANLP